MNESDTDLILTPSDGGKSLLDRETGFKYLLFVRKITSWRLNSNLKKQKIPNPIQ